MLVTLDNGKPVPKIIDFGVAKATEQRLTEKTLFTQFGVLVGTPEYMSPEQAELTGEDIDIRTDVYSLGMVLYELLTGDTPYVMQDLYGRTDRVTPAGESLVVATLDPLALLSVGVQTGEVPLTATAAVLLPLSLALFDCEPCSARRTPQCITRGDDDELMLMAPLSGSVLIEIVFAWPGMGRLIVNSIFSQDTTVVIGCFFVFTLMVVLGNLIADISYALVDPRISYS